MQKNPSETDVVIVGGGPAGLATAIAARAKGLRVIVIDCAEPPVDKACGEGIMPDGLEALAKIGVSLPTTDSASFGAFEGVRFVDRAGEVRAKFSSGSGYGVRRPVLHSLLIEHAQKCGVELRWKQPLLGLEDHAVVLANETLRARFVVGADGSSSKMRRLAKLEDGRIIRRRFGFRRHYSIAPWSPCVEVHWSDRGQMYVTPISASEVCVALITADQHLRFDDALADFPQLHQHLHGVDPSTRLKGAVTVTRRLRHVSKNEIALVGDASGSPDAITGDGLSVSFRQALVLADAMASGSLSRYGAAHRKISRLPIFMGELMLSMSDYPRFRHRVFSVFDQHPEYFQRLLALHTGSASLFDLGLANTLSLGWRLLTI